MDKDLKYLNDLTWGYRASRVLQTAVGLDVFTHLSDGGKNCSQLAELCGAREDMMEKLLIACTAMGFVQRDGEVFSNTELAEKYLVRSKPLYQGDIIQHAAGWVWDFWNSLPEKMLKEPPVKSENEKQMHRNFILGMHNITMAGRGELFLDSIDLTGRKLLLDVGGGPGTYSILACRKYRDLRAVVFDLPETIDMARQVIADEGMTERVSVRPGSWDSDDFGEDFDAVLISNVMHGPPSKAGMKLAKAYDAMEADGLLMVQEFLLDDDKAGPVVPALFNVMVGAYSQAELTALIEQAGFEDTRLVANDRTIGCSWLTAVKKT